MNIMNSGNLYYLLLNTSSWWQLDQTPPHRIATPRWSPSRLPSMYSWNPWSTFGGTAKERRSISSGKSQGNDAYAEPELEGKQGRARDARVHPCSLNHSYKFCIFQDELNRFFLTTTIIFNRFLTTTTIFNRNTTPVSISMSQGK